ncbi:E3 ubiquitin-protein ligase ZFP91 isoform X6 [Macrotis lagotis]|uniref:E3 ubiquitin-protein ligase ZFP91 isoform X6 n=1 Tax=Macrotis lagotis TaxID=92651 RepID=UPI003D697DD0
MPGGTEEPRPPEQEQPQPPPPQPELEPQPEPEPEPPRPEQPGAEAAAEQERRQVSPAPAGPGSRVLRGGRERGRAAAAAAAAAAASRRRKAEYPRRRRSSPSARAGDAAEGRPGASAAEPAAAKKSARLAYTEKVVATSKDPKEEKEEEDNSILAQEAAPRSSRGWRSSSRTAAASRQCDTENTRSSRSKTGSLQLICKSEPNTEQLEYDITEEHHSPGGVRRGRRRKDDKSPRLPKRRKKPPIQYVRCEMEGCGTVLAHPRYLQHHIKYQHMLKKKYVCPHPSCGRLFRLQKQLLRHAKHHTDQRDYICEYCARAFKSSHNLAVHRMIHTGEKPLQCEICGFTCRQKASLNWHMKKHDADSFYQFSCNICGKKFEKKDSVVAHKAKSHPEVLIAEALAANAGALITSTDILGTNPESLAQPTDAQGLPLLPEPLGNSAPAECLLLDSEGMPKAFCSGAERVSLMADGKIFVGSGSSGGTEGLVMNTEILGATTEVLIEDSDSTGP